jgi:hypothetical protein
MFLEKVISGGQTGVDRAGLDVAMQFGLQIGGTAPPGSAAEDGTVPAFYGLTPLPPQPPEDGRRARTIKNVENADATLIIRSNAPSPGTDLTEETAKRLGKPCGVFRIEQDSDAAELARTGADIANWIGTIPGSLLNIAGPSEDEAHLYWNARECLTEAFTLLQQRQSFRSREVSREEAIDLFKHWDTIRWQGPAWLSAAVAVVGSVMSSSYVTKWLSSRPTSFIITGNRN